jgi:hypothetical protein
VPLAVAARTRRCRREALLADIIFRLWVEDLFMACSRPVPGSVCLILLDHRPDSTAGETVGYLQATWRSIRQMPGAFSAGPPGRGWYSCPHRGLATPGYRPAPLRGELPIETCRTDHLEASWSSIRDFAGRGRELEGAAGGSGWTGGIRTSTPFLHRPSDPPCVHGTSRTRTCKGCDTPPD